MLRSLTGPWTCTADLGITAGHPARHRHSIRGQTIPFDSSEESCSSGKSNPRGHYATDPWNVSLLWSFCHLRLPRPFGPHLLLSVSVFVYACGEEVLRASHTFSSQLIGVEKVRRGTEPQGNGSESQHRLRLAM